MFLGCMWVARTLLFFCPQLNNPRKLQMWYPICVESCPEGGKVICPRNINQDTTTTTSTTLMHFYDSMRGRNGVQGDGPEDQKG